jgi:hypothetical protein
MRNQYTFPGVRPPMTARVWPWVRLDQLCKSALHSNV